jgi:NhaP-type Na+/H+ or K+/H+ antiporter
MVTLAIVNEAFFSTLLVLALIIGVGAVLGRIMEIFKIPSITGYFLSGILIGLFLISIEMTEIYDSLSVLGNIALGFIAFELGTRLHRSKMMHGFSEVIVIVLFQSIFTIVLVMILFLVFGAPWEIALIVGVIAMATSPETIMVLTRKYKTKGHLTDAIMPHIGMDDILGVILFSVVVAIATAVSGRTEVSPEAIVWEPVLEIFGSAIIGALIGTALAFFINTTKKRKVDIKTSFLMESVFAIILIEALTSHTYEFGHIHFILSPILTPMFAGIFMTNFTTKQVRKENDEVLDAFTPPFILVFFALIGMQLMISIEISTLAIWMLALMAFSYAVVRVVGKQIGVIVGSKVKHTPPSVVKYLVRCLLPQATVSIGMASIVLHNESLPIYWREIVFIIVLFAGVFYQLIGPLFSIKGLINSSEIDPEQLAYFLGDKTSGHEHMPAAFELPESKDESENSHEKDATH